MTMQPPTEALVEAARDVARTDVWQRDQVAWNLPRASGQEPGSSPSIGLDWVGFSHAFYPGSRRHDLHAITAYAAYRRSTRDV